MDTTCVTSHREVDLFRDRLALADRIMLALVIYSMGLGLYFVYSWGIVAASTRFLFDAVGLGIITVLLVVPVLLVMVAAHWRRRLAGAALVGASYVIGLGVWCFALAVAWDYAGTTATTVGIAAAGVGVIPVAAAGLALKGQWLAAIAVIVTAALVIVIRRLGMAAAR